MIRRQQHRKIWCFPLFVEFNFTLRVKYLLAVVYVGKHVYECVNNLMSSN